MLKNQGKKTKLMRIKYKCNVCVLWLSKDWNELDIFFFALKNDIPQQTNHLS